jgi:hypothetical protein
MRIVWLITLVFASCLIGGCASDNPALVDRIRGVDATVVAVPSSVHAGEEIAIHVALENRGADTAFVSCCEGCDTLEYYVTDGSGRRLVTPSPGRECTGCPVGMGIFLGPGQTLMKTWTQPTDRWQPGVFVVHAGDKYKHQYWATTLVVVRDE